MFPTTVKKNFEKLAVAYAAAKNEFPHLRGITLAQWALESGWGGTGLASRHNNYAGAKWRKYMAPYGYQVQYDAHDGREWYVHFTDEAAFIAGYWKRLDLEPAYAGWREHTATPEEFIKFVGPIWVGTDDADKQRYVRDVLRICNAWKLADHFKTTEIVNEDKDINHLELSGSPSTWDSRYHRPS
jgi:hypothetical protein